MTRDTTKLRRMIEDVSWKVEIIFEAEGRLTPTYYFVDGLGKTHIEGAPPFGKGTSVALMKALFETLYVRRCVFVDEGWTVHRDAKDGDLKEFAKRAREHGIQDHPDRIEVVMFVAEDEHGTILAQRKIERPTGRKPRLGPLITDEEFVGSEGRMIGLLPTRRKGL